MTTLYNNARLLDPASGLDMIGALVVHEGKIAKVSNKVFVDSSRVDSDIIDCGERCLAPGLVDMRAQVREPGNEHIENMSSAQKAAVAGGITTFAPLPNTNPVIDDVSLLEFVQRRALEIGLANVHPYAAITKGLRGHEITEFGMLADSGAVAFTDGKHSVANSLVMRRALSYASMFKRTIVQHPEDPYLASKGSANEGQTATRLGLSGIPSAAEVIMLERDLRLVELTGGNYHAAHLSTAAAVEAIRQAKKRGLPVTCETAPPYFALNEDAIIGYRTFARLSPPLRSEQDRLAVVAGLADGTIDAIASDHDPHDPDRKNVPFSQAAPGGIGLETLLTISLELVHTKAMKLIDLLQRLTVAPARILGLPYGTLKVGGDADLVIFDLNRIGKVAPERFASKSRNTPFDKRPIEGRVWRTVYRGNVVYDVEK
ncbi:dihydroorotase [Candidatus Endolissoclinum faulkneri L5]|uniref:Dihydroorotase n=1 Tax=Candidatus Endolissoclinum faulkneri L5 TaxID=1401328 RepID=V9TXB8_9PROT|nr:dihydroorotase [Candidatus Endolissoclinum faulkneri]AHC73975.1 dihydroorotase [Candidatus Endolissoclinum faulkneri L5]